MSAGCIRGVDISGRGEGRGGRKGIARRASGCLEECVYEAVGSFGGDGEDMTACGGSIYIGRMYCDVEGF